MSVKEPSHRGQKRKDRDSPGHPPSTPRPDRFPVIQKGVTFSVVEIDGRLRALKHFPPSGDFYFHSGLPSLAEIDLTSRLKHPALLSREVLLGPSSVSEIAGLSLVYPLPAFDLYDALSSPLFPFSARFRLLEELFSTLSYLHSQGVLHLNLSLPAVTLSGSAESPRCTLGSLEGALYVDDVGRGRRLPGPLLGAPDHLAPELLEQALRLSRREKKKLRREPSPEPAKELSTRTALSWLSEVPSAKPDSPFKLSPRVGELEEESGILYTGAVDVWALGVLSLYVLSAQGIYPCFAKGSALPPGWQSSVLSYVKEYFSAGRREETLSHFLQAVPRKIRPRVNTPLLLAMLDLEPGRRPKAQELGPLLLPAPEKSVFQDLVNNADVSNNVGADNVSNNVNDNVAGSLGPDFHNLNKLMILFLIHAYGGERMEVLFLAVDLLYRAALRFRPQVTDEERLVTAACCMFMAAKLVRETSKPEEEGKEGDQVAFSPSRADVWAPSVHRAALVAAEQSGGEVTAHKILERELSLVEELGGVLYPPRWYHACRTRYQLSCVYEKVIRRPVDEYQRGFRPPALLREEVEAEFGEAPEEMAGLPQDKDITIEEYFS